MQNGSSKYQFMTPECELHPQPTHAGADSLSQYPVAPHGPNTSGYCCLFSEPAASVRVLVLCSWNLHPYCRARSELSYLVLASVARQAVVRRGVGVFRPRLEAAPTLDLALRQRRPSTSPPARVMLVATAFVRPVPTLNSNAHRNA